jgi:hypothetical protein
MPIHSVPKILVNIESSEIYSYISTLTVFFSINFMNFIVVKIKLFVQV